MITLKNLPVDYVPFQRMKLCGNDLINVTVLLEIGELVPLLIGVGPSFPLIWCAAPRDPAATSYVEIIERSVSKSSAFQITENNGEVVVHAGKHLLLRVQQISREAASCHFIDLRPIGYAFFGSKNDGLSLGYPGAQVITSRFEQVQVLAHFSPAETTGKKT